MPTVIGAAAAIPFSGAAAGAAFSAKFETSVVAAASGTLSYSPPTNGRIAPDHDGVLRRVNAGEPRFWGARRVENHLPICTSFSSPWSRSLFGTASLELTATENEIEIIGGANDSAFRAILIITTTSLKSNTPYSRWAISCYVENVYGLEDMAEDGTVIDVFSTTNTTPTAVSSGAIAAASPAGSGTKVRICALLSPGADADGQIRIGLGTNVAKTTGANGLKVRFSDFQVEEVGGASVDCCGDYVKPGIDYLGNNVVTGVQYFDTENGNSVNASGIVTEAAGAALTTMHGWYAEPTYTQSCQKPVDLTIDASNWYGPAGTVTTALDSSVLNPSGRYASWVMTAIAGAGNHRMYTGAIAKSAADEVWTISVYAKKGTERYFNLQLANNVETDYAKLGFDFDTPSNITHVTPGAFTTHDYGYEDVGGGWYRLWLTATVPAAETNIRVHLRHSASLGGSSSFTAAGTETVYLWGANLSMTQRPMQLYEATGGMSNDAFAEWGDGIFPDGQGEQVSLEYDLFVPYSLANVPSFGAARPFGWDSNEPVIWSTGGSLIMYQSSDGTTAFDTLANVFPADATSINVKFRMDTIATSQRSIGVDGTVVSDSPLAGNGDYDSKTTASTRVHYNSGSPITSGMALKNVSFWTRDLGLSWVGS